MTSRPPAAPATERRLVVDPVACEGVGMCAHLAPDVVGVDSWGYPIVRATPLSPRLERQAARAVAGCPRRALLLADRPPAR